jgi:hypothetical protein
LGKEYRSLSSSLCSCRYCPKFIWFCNYFVAGSFYDALLNLMGVYIYIYIYIYVNGKITGTLETVLTSGC